MTKIVRHTGNLKVFGQNIADNKRTVFGALASPLTKSDTLDGNLTNFLDGLNAINNLPANSEGKRPPPVQWINSIHYTLSLINAYLIQTGVAEYDVAQEYHVGSIANSGGDLYKSITNNNTGNAVTDIVNWEKLPTRTELTTALSNISTNATNITTLQNSEFGVNQTWQDVTASRVFGSVYTNTTTKPIVVVCGGSGHSGVGVQELTVDGLIIDTMPNVTGTVFKPRLSAIVPPNSTYSCTAGSALTLIWYELR